MEKTEKDNILRRQVSGLQLRAQDPERRMVEFIASTSSVDSYGTVLPVDLWELARYEKNGVVGYQHDIYWSDDPDNVIGRGEAFIEDDALIIRIFFEPADINEKAEKVYKKVLFGSINAVSVGFQPTAPGHWGDERDGEDPDVYYYAGQELLEVSVVNVPSNPDAVKRSAAEELAPHLKEKKTSGNDPASAGSEPDNSSIRLTIARAMRQLAQ